MTLIGQLTDFLTRHFNTPWLLLGLLAAAIPVVLHLLSSVRAPEAYFPTLRFLKISMQKTARRRRLQHWLLLLIRSLLFAFLALAVAEPIRRASAGFWADRRFAAAVVVDDSYSMGVRSAGLTRLDRARREAGELLGGDNQPTVAALLLTDAAQPPRLRSDLKQLRDGLLRAHTGPGKAPIAQRLARAAELLEDHDAAQKAIYVFSDLQRISFEGLANMPELKKANTPVMLVDCSRKQVANVGIADLRITGSRVLDQAMEFTATLVNSSRTDKVVHVWLQVDGQSVGQPVRKVLERAQDRGTRTPVRFYHRFSTPGVHTGQVAIAEDDDLPIDNVRRFSLEVADRVNALLVRPAGASAGAFDPAAALQLALDPYAGGPWPWSVRLKTIASDRLDEAALAGTQVVFLADVPAFSDARARALERFVRRGGSAVFFLGPAVDVKNYNDVFVQRIRDFGGLLPGRIEKAVGQVGLAAEAVQAVKDLRHPYLADLYETSADYPEVLVQRYYRLAGAAAGIEKVLATPAGEPILSAKSFGAGRVVLAATTASAEWNNLSTTAVFLPMLARICLEAGQRLGADHTHPAGAEVIIRPKGSLPDKAAINVSLPSGQTLPLEAGKDKPEVAFTRTAAPGLYRWQVVGAAPDAEGMRGAFATNPDGAETDLTRVKPSAVAAAVSPADVYTGGSLKEVNAAAAEAASRDNLWDRLLAVVILLLVVEAVVANRFRRGTEPVPRHLNPRLAA